MHVLWVGDRIFMARARARDDDDIDSGGEEEDDDDDNDDNAVGQWTTGEGGTAVAVDNTTTSLTSPSPAWWALRICRRC